MTIKELIEWAKKHDCLDCEVCVQYRDEGGLVSGNGLLYRACLES